jgi:hypothetical protein
MNSPVPQPEVEDAVEMILAGSNLAEAARCVGLTRQHLRFILRARYGGLGALRRVLGVRIGPQVQPATPHRHVAQQGLTEERNRVEGTEPPVSDGLPGAAVFGAWRAGA